MKGIDDLKLLEGLDDELIASAEKLTKKRSPALAALPIAAGLCLVIGAALVLSKVFPRESKPDVSAMETEPAARTEAATEAPPAEPENPIDLAHYVGGGYNEDGVFELDLGGIETTNELPGGEEPAISFLKGFFIHDGRLYSELFSCSALANIIGDTVCGIDPFDNAELQNDLDAVIGRGQPPQIDAAKYEGNGTMQAVMHEVRGYEPELLLCMRDEGLGRIIVYTADLGLTERPAEELFEGRLGLSRDIDKLYYSVTMRNDEAPFGFEEVKYVIDAADFPDETAKLIEALDGAEWIDDVKNQFSYSFVEGAADGFNDYPNSYFVNVEIPLKHDLMLSFWVYTDGTAVFPYSYFDKALKLDGAKLAPFLALVEGGAGSKLEFSPLDARTIEACRADKQMGHLVPDYLPDGYQYRTTVAFYEYDRLTGAIIGTESIRIEYKNYSNDAVINLWILRPDRFESESGAFIERGGVVVPLSELTLDDIVEWNNRPEIPEDVVSLAAVTDGEYGICVEAIGADARTVYAILDSILN